MKSLLGPLSPERGEPKRSHRIPVGAERRRRADSAQALQKESTILTPSNMSRTSKTCQNADPMAAPVPIHPSFEDRPDVPDRVFASLDDDAYHRQVAVWQSLLERVEMPDLYHVHHLTYVNDAVAALGDRPTVVHLHGTELNMLAEIRLSGAKRWKHAGAWDQRMVRAGRRADRLVVVY